MNEVRWAKLSCRFHAFGACFLCLTLLNLTFVHGPSVEQCLTPNATRGSSIVLPLGCLKSRMFRVKMGRNVQGPTFSGSASVLRRIYASVVSLKPLGAPHGCTAIYFVESLPTNSTDPPPTYLMLKYTQYSQYSP